MNYQKIYDNLVKKNHDFQDGEYFESHHILPKSLGGKDTNDNLVRLTAREHYIAHALLVKISEQNGDTSSYNRMLYAFNCMKWGSVNGDRNFKFNSKLYQKLKGKYSCLRQELMVNGITNPSFGKSWIHNIELRQSKLWDMSIPLPIGWEVGRVLNWERKIVELNDEKVKPIKQKKLLENKVSLFTNMYYDFMSKGLDFVRIKYKYSKTEENLGRLFKKYVKEYDRKILRKISFKRTRESGQYKRVTKNMSKEEKQTFFTNVWKFFELHGLKETMSYYSFCFSEDNLIYNFKKYAYGYSRTIYTKIKNNFKTPLYFQDDLV